MLSKVPGYKDEKVGKNIKAGDLSAERSEVTRDDFDKALGFKITHGTPKGSFATARFRANLGGFRINLSVVGPETEKSKNYFTLTIRETKDINKAAANLVKMLKEKAF